MKNVNLSSLVLFASFLLMSFIIFQKKHIKVYLIGDSTMAIKETKAYPETGWGMPFSIFFDSTVTVDNRAKNGRSTRTFIEEGLWKPVFDNLQNGDYVFIQFGHNDEVSTKKSFTTEEEFKNNLARYITESRSKKAIPILLTPVARRKFDSTGRIAGTHDVYSELVRSVAKKYNVALIDHDKKSQALLQQLGVRSSALLFNHLEAGEHPNYADGKIDDTHFNEVGARMMAQIVLKEIRNLKLELAERIVDRTSK
jgi:lysophospholipase L1-like esterase